jgi:glycosyltransferase involved in cell wall biosynthesis
VGANPRPEVQELAAQNNIVVTGKVADVRPYLAHASVAVAPLRIARGIQNKVLEAMAMARPVIVSTEALNGISATPGHDVIVADNAGDMVKAINDVLDLKHDQLGPNARRTICESYNWTSALSRLDKMLAVGRITEVVS